jgi:hypothetical protein
VDDFEEILSIAVQHEIKLKELYHLFSENFIDDKVFWQKASEEEEAHAQWIENISKLYKRGEIHRKTTNLKVQGIKSATDYVDSIIARCERNEVSRMQALSLAHDLEKGMVESKYLKSFNFLSGKYTDVGTKLEAATVRHRDRILERLNNVKKSLKT